MYTPPYNLATTDAVKSVRPMTIAMNIGVISKAVFSMIDHDAGLSGIGLMTSGIVDP